MKTKSEEIFEAFLNENNLKFEKINENASPRPDYIVETGKLKLAFEVKELAKDENFKIGQFAVSSHEVGKHIRQKIDDAKKQIQFAASNNIPAVLLIYNNIDLMHLFGTKNHDFISAMYGDYTVVLNKNTNKITDSFHGKNKSLQKIKNTSFSAIGRLSPCSGQMRVTLFENVFAKVKIEYKELPSCFDVINIKIESR